MIKPSFRLTLAVLAATVALVGCAKQEQAVAEDKTFTATIEQGLTKTTFTEDNKILWQAGDRVSINGAEYSAVPKNPASEAVFQHTSGPEPATGPYTAIFPANLYNAATGGYELPSANTYKGNLNTPMYAESDTKKLSFHNICGVLHFSLTGTDVVRTITVTANENICGPFFPDIAQDGAFYMCITNENDAAYKTITLDCGEQGVQLDPEEATDFFISLPPQTYSPGMTITLNCDDPNTLPIVKTTATAIDIRRNAVYNLDWEAEFVFVPADKYLGAAIETFARKKKFGQRVILMLKNDVVYDLEKAADAGLVSLVINGNGAVVNVLNGAQITGMQGIEINSVNFNCAANTTTAPIALSANPDNRLSVSNISEEGTTFSPNSGYYYNLKTVSLNNCNFSEVRTSLISNSNQNWNLKTLAIRNCIVQFDVASGINSYINWSVGSYGSIKDIIICGSTLYNIVTDNNNYFLSFANASNSQAQKRWPTPQFDAQESWTMENNTFVNLPSNKKFADQYPSKNNVTLNWTGNIFYNVYRLQNASQNAVRTFTAADNAICGITNAVYAADKSTYATEDTLLCEGDSKFVVPTTSLDLASPYQLKMNFQPSGASYAGQRGFGDPRWLEP